VFAITVTVAPSVLASDAGREAVGDPTFALRDIVEAERQRRLYVFIESGTIELHNQETRYAETGTASLALIACLRTSLFGCNFLLFVCIKSLIPK